MNQISQLIGQWGVPFVFGNVLAEQAGLPLPAMPTLLVAGALAADGKLSIPWVLAAAVAASMIPDTAWYFAGRRFGHRALKTVCRVSFSPNSCVRQTETIFERYGLYSLLFAKFIPGFSTVAPPLAGIVKTRLSLFLAFNAAGALVWAAAPVAGGLLLHTAVDRVLVTLERLGALGLGLIVLALALYLLARWARLALVRRKLHTSRISTEDLHRLMNDGSRPLVLDLRSDLAFKVDPRMIPGSIRMHPEMLDAALKDVPREHEIIVFCTCPGEATSARMAAEIQKRGFHRIRPLAGGFDAWVSAGYELHGGPVVP